jgi:hypothetical protein
MRTIVRACFVVDGRRCVLHSLLFVAAVLNATYQFFTQQFIYPLELLFTVTLLALVPYVILHVPAIRIPRGFIGHERELADKTTGP